MPKKKVFSTVVLSFLLWILVGFPLLNIGEAQSPEVVVGVKVGDWVKYGNISVTWNSAVMEPDPEHEELNNTLWFKNEVLDIKDTTIISSQTTQFRNNTQRTSVFYLDVNTGDGNDTLMFISSGLSVNDPLYPAATYPIWINSTIYRIYVYVIREVNGLEVWDTLTTEEDPPKFLQFSMSYYWDKETGVLTARSGAGIYTDEAGNQIATWTRSDEIIETNLWSPPEDSSKQSPEPPYAIVVVATVAVILIGAWVLWPQKKKPRKRSPRKRRKA